MSPQSRFEYIQESPDDETLNAVYDLLFGILEVNPTRP